MSENEKNVPKRRFREFENGEDWEQRKLCKVAGFSKGRGYSKNDLVEAGTPIILYGRMYTKYQTVISKVDTFALANNGSVYSNGTEVIVPASGETSEDIARATAIAKSGILLGGDLNIIYPNDNINTIFLALAISNGKQQKELSKRAQGKSVVHLHNCDLKELDIFYPSKKEQIGISSFFTNIDNLITLHQHKLDKMKALKKAYLTDMFPAEGECTPKLRFAGFTDDWEQCELNELADVRDGTHDSPQYLPGGHPFVTSKNVKNGYINYDDIQYISDVDFDEINKRSKVDINDILMGMIGTIGNIALVRERPDFAIKNVALIKDIKSVHYLYLYHYLQSPSILKQLAEGMDGGTQKFIALNKIRNLLIAIPSKEEQNNVGNYIEKLDNLITLHQRKLKKLKDVKKAYLNEMFI